MNWLELKRLRVRYAIRELMHEVSAKDKVILKKMINNYPVEIDADLTPADYNICEGCKGKFHYTQFPEHKVGVGYNRRISGKNHTYRRKFCHKCWDKKLAVKSLKTMAKHGLSKIHKADIDIIDKKMDDLFTEHTCLYDLSEKDYNIYMKLDKERDRLIKFLNDDIDKMVIPDDMINIEIMIKKVNFKLKEIKGYATS